LQAKVVLKALMAGASKDSEQRPVRPQWLAHLAGVQLSGRGQIRHHYRLLALEYRIASSALHPEPIRTRPL